MLATIGHLRPNLGMVSLWGLHRLLAAFCVPVTQETKDRRSNRSKKQGQGNSSADLRFTRVVIIGKLDRLDAQSVEIKGIRSPSRKPDNKVKPARGRELHEERNGIAKGLGLLPFRPRFAKFIAYLYPLRPDEEVAEGLFGGGPGSCGDGLRRRASGFHSDECK